MVLKLNSILVAATLLAQSTLTVAQSTTATSVAAVYTEDPSLTGHTIYLPEDTAAFDKLPVIVWGNGACAANGTAFANFLLEVASWGHIAIASGSPDGSGQTTSQQMRDSIDWAVANAGSGAYANMDTTRLAAAGMSCGGIEAYDQWQDPRVTLLGIFNSGQLSPEASLAIVPGISVPLFFFLGGPTDIAYANGERDYANVQAGVPSWFGNFPVGHGGTYGDPQGGAFGVAGQHFFRWLLRGDASAAPFFTEDGAVAAGWTVQSKSLENVNVTPI